MDSHIKKLVQFLNEKREAREKQRTEEERKTERKRTIDKALSLWSTEFWCAKCEKDFVRQAHKVVITAYSEPVAFYETKCPKNLHVCRRRITDKLSDPYYFESAQLRRARVEMEKDLLQPGDPRFRAVYGDPLKKYYEELEAKEKAAWQRRKDNPTSATTPSSPGF